MLDVAIRKTDGSTAVDWATVGVRSAPPLPVDPVLQTVLPNGLRRGSTVHVSGSLSLLLALLGAASNAGAWCALVGFPRISAEAAREYGVDLRRLALIPAPGASWTIAVGALLDSLDVVAARPPARLVPGDVRRLAARARSKDAVLMPYGGGWPGADVRLEARAGPWAGIGEGTGRLRARSVEVNAGGRGPSARPRTATLWLPADRGGLGNGGRGNGGLGNGPVEGPAEAAPLAPVIDLAG